MSENVIDHGIMIPLKQKIEDEKREEINDNFYYNDSLLRINYEGTIVYSADRANDFGIYLYNEIKEKDIIEFENELKKYGLEADFSKAKNYICSWYNGSDSDMDLMTIEEFLSE